MQRILHSKSHVNEFVAFEIEIVKENPKPFGNERVKYMKNALKAVAKVLFTLTHHRIANGRSIVTMVLCGMLLQTTYICHPVNVCLLALRRQEAFLLQFMKISQLFVFRYITHQLRSHLTKMYFIIFSIRLFVMFSLIFHIYSLSLA